MLPRHTLRHSESQSNVVQQFCVLLRWMRKFEDLHWGKNTRFLFPRIGWNDGSNLLLSCVLALSLLALQEDYHLLYKAMESNCDESTTSADRDSGISNCNNFPATMPASRVTDSSLNKHSSNSNNMANNKHEATTTM